MSEKEDPKKVSRKVQIFWYALGAFLFGTTLSFDPLYIDRSLVELRSRGMLDWIVQERDPKQETPPAEEVGAGKTGEAKEVEKPSTEQPVQVVEDPPKPIENIPDRTYILNGRDGSLEAIGTFATLELPGLTPGTNVAVSLYLPEKDQYPEINFSFPPGKVGSSGLFSAKLPQFIRYQSSGESIDLSQRRYRFTVRVDDPRFDCKVRFAVMTEGRLKWRFLSAERVFCAQNQGTPDLY